MGWLDEYIYIYYLYIVFSWKYFSFQTKNIYIIHNIYEYIVIKHTNFVWPGKKLVFICVEI
jgi:hypothetical protein